jgi:lactate 2-monooxygenase
MAPVGVQGIFHEDREIGLSSVCAELGVPFVLSTSATSSIEEVAQANGNGPRWYQLYWPKDDSITLSYLKRAKENGYTALVVTLDTWTLAWRPSDLDAGYIPFATGVGNQIGFSDPVFREHLAKNYNTTPEENVLLASQVLLGQIFFGASHGWEDLAFLRKNWDGPIILKGIQHPEDAKLAVEHGCDGIVVSNHGGMYPDPLMTVLVC